MCSPIAHGAPSLVRRAPPVVPAPWALQRQQLWYWPVFLLSGADVQAVTKVNHDSAELRNGCTWTRKGGRDPRDWQE